MTNIDGGCSRRVPGMPLMNGRKDHRDHDQDLILFQELQKHEKERKNIASLLQPVSDEFEPNGNYQLYRIASAKKGSGLEFLAENDKNDYDWLKTPPATPLFPSLEMETNGPELVIQREIPILQPLSRFAAANCKSEAVLEASNGRLNYPNPKPKLPLRSVTQSQISGRSIVSNQTKNTKARSPPAILNQQKATKSAAGLITGERANNVVNHTHTAKSIDQKESHTNFLTSQFKNMGIIMDSKSTSKPATSRGASPLVRSTLIPSQLIPGFSNEKPPNLRTDQRSTSAYRPGRPSKPAPATDHRKAAELPAPPKLRRQSCSPSVSRGRKIEAMQQNFQGNVNTQKGRIQTGNGTQVFGSRMVERVMNARKAATHDQEKDKKQNSRFLINGSSGFNWKNI